MIAIPKPLKKATESAREHHEAVSEALLMHGCDEQKSNAVASDYIVNYFRKATEVREQRAEQVNHIID